ncbi:MAG: rod-binding protein [Bdellovibrionaceae bacterium]|nr:rod-binding protein [Pseudobdellovibrionaceae bacterium]
MIKFLAHNPSFFFLTSLFFLSPLSAEQKEPLPIKKEIPTLRNTMDIQSETQKKDFEMKMQSAAELYEKQFLRNMVNAMRSTIKYSDISQPTMAEQIYKDKLYEEYVEKWSQRGGVGFREIIYQQLLERYSPYHRSQESLAKGPIDLEKSRPRALKDPKGGKNIPRLKMEE